MKNNILVLISLLSVSVYAGDEKSSSSQPSPIATMVEDGNALLKKGQFSAAMAVWQKVLESEPDNANANFKMGMCWYNSIDESPKALPYFKKAAKKISNNYDFFSATEKNAPADVFYFLGETYLASDLADSALWMFFQYEDKFNGNPPIPVDRQIRNCINAKNSKKNPRDVSMKNPGKNVNSTFAETNPVLTIDNSVLFFASRRVAKDANKQPSPVNGKFDMDIYYTFKDKSGKWEPAIPFKWNTDKDEAPLYISPDGLTLYFCKDVKGQSDIYMSQYIDKVWSSPKPVSEINSVANETGLSISADGKYLYFCSDRDGGNGKFDIYQCTKAGSKWSAPKNISSLNTTFSEISPYVNPNGKTLFFASNGYRDGMGGYDIFYSELKDDGTWSHPANMGFPINTTRDDINYYITGGGNRYYATVRDDKESYDIFKIEGGGFPVENIESGGVVTLTQEMNVSDVVEVQKTVEKEVEVVETVETTVEVIKEVEKVDVEKEKRKMDSMMVIAKKEAALEKQQIELEKAKYEAQIAQAHADSMKAIADAKTAEANKAKAEADAKKADADKAKADAEKAKSDALISSNEATKAKAEATIAAAQKAKDDAAAAKANADAKKAEADKAKADAATAASEAAKVKAEADKLKAQENAAKAVADKATAEQKNNELKIQLAEAEKPKNEALKAKADADKAKAEADKLKAQETIAAAQKSKSDAVIAAAEKSKADAETAKAKAEIAAAEKAKAETEKADAAAKKAQADADAVKAKAEIAAAEKAKADAAKAQAEATKADAAAKAAQAAADAKKADAEKAAADAAAKKADADKVKEQAEAQKAQAAADKAKADAEKAASDAAKMQAAADKAKADAEKAKADAEAKKAQAEILKAQQPKTNPASKTGTGTQGGK